MELKFYLCKHCGNIVTKVKDAGVPIVCCGEKMTELVPGAVDAAKEKHVPVVSVDGNHVSVTVGSVTHPMTPEHLIEWIALQTSAGTQLKYLTADAAPSASFLLAEGETAQAVYAYCNLHGLWTAAL